MMDEGRNDLTTLEVLAMGIKAEMEAADLYNRMKEKAPCEDFARKMDYLIEQEKRHEMILRRAYESQFPEVELKVPEKSAVPTIKDVLACDTEMKELFDAAIEAEKIAQEFYRDLAKRTKDSNAKSLLEYLASMERSHQSILEAEYKQFEFTSFQDVDDFLSGERFMNLGP